MIGVLIRKLGNVKWLEYALKFGSHAYAITWQMSFNDYLHSNLDASVVIKSSVAVIFNIKFSLDFHFSIWISLIKVILMNA